MAAPTAAVVWGDFIIPGVPSSGNKKPKKAEARAWGAYLESFITAIGTSGGSIYLTRSSLFADLAHAANDAAWVIQDPTVAFNGIYRKNGNTGTGSWTRVADLPYSFIEASNTGAGTANAIQATTTIPVSESALVLLNFTADNTGAMTVSFNGASPVSIKSNSGNDIAPGGVTGNMLVIGRLAGSTFRIVTDQVSSAIVAAAEAAQAAAESAASSLLFRIYPDVATATGASISATASYIAIASYSPQPRFYKRFPSNPGSGDRFQSADGAWWQGPPLPGTTIDYVNAVQRSSNASLVSGDLDLAHRWTIPVGTTYTVTLPDPSLYVGRVLDIGVNDSSRGKLAVAFTTYPVGKFAAGGLFMWAGENMTLIARATQWEIIGGRCIPCTLFATAPGPDLGMTSGAVVNLSGWQTGLGGTIHAGAEHALNGSGQIVIPRQGFYTLDLDVAYAWSGSGTRPADDHAYRWQGFHDASSDRGDETSMSRARKPARLWLRPASKDRAAAWVVLDGGKQFGTGCSEHYREGAEKALAEHIGRQFLTQPPSKNRQASEVPIPEVLAHYLSLKKDSATRPRELAARAENLMSYWGDKTLDDITSATCAEYVKKRGTPNGARRELEDLRAACRQAIADKVTREAVTVTLPPKAKGRVKHLERSTMAKLIWAAYRKRSKYRGVPNKWRPTIHIARFTLAAVYTGSRSARVWQASFVKEEGRPYIDLEDGVFYRAWEGEAVADNKRAPPIRLPGRLLAHMRRWHRMMAPSPWMMSWRLCARGSLMNRIVIELNDIQAEALAQFCKRTFVDRVRPFSSSKDEAWQMVDAIGELRAALSKAGWTPR